MLTNNSGVAPTDAAEVLASSIEAAGETVADSVNAAAVRLECVIVALAAAVANLSVSIDRSRTQAIGRVNFSEVISVDTVLDNIDPHN